jgi:poly(3-hydroxybutyrate) depolymerase
MGNTFGFTPNGQCEKVKQESFDGTTLAMYSMRLGHEQRTFVVCVPDHMRAEERCSCVFYAHGVGGTAWYGAKEDTGWVRVAREKSFIVVFLQSKGIFFDEQRKNSTGKSVWAASSWDCTYSAGDLAYTQTVHDAVVTQLFPGVVDVGHVYFCGFDSGGMFAWPVACAFGNLPSCPL